MILFQIKHFDRNPQAYQDIQGPSLYYEEDQEIESKVKMNKNDDITTPVSSADIARSLLLKKSYPLLQ